MKTKQLGVCAAAAVMALAIPAAAFGQLAGQSHPDEVPVATTPDGVSQPLVYIPTPAPVAPHAAAPVAPALPASSATEYSAYVPLHPPVRGAQGFDPDAAIAGDAMPLPKSEADLDAGIVTKIAGPANRLPEGTLIYTRMLQGLSTASTEQDTLWRAELTQPVMRDGRVLIPAGAILSGRVTEVHGGKRISGRALIHLETSSVAMPDGLSIGLHAQVVDTNLNSTTKVDQEGTILHRDHRKEQVAVLAMTAGSGAAAGGLMAGVPGALIGAGVGAGVSTVIWLKQDRQAELPKETQVTFELSRALSIGVE